jgi:hypothetical protein
LDIGDAQNVGGIYVGARIPGLNSFQQWDGLGRTASEIVGESKELDCFVVTSILLQGFLKVLNCLHILAFVVVCGA